MDHVAFAFAHPVYDPGRQIVQSHHWKPERDVSACLTVNIGME